MQKTENLWKITRDIKSADLPENLKTLLFAGNGYIGLQAVPLFFHRTAGTFINGFYESLPITYGEKAFGYPAEQQIMVPLVDIQSWAIYKMEPRGDVPMVFRSGQIELNMKKGIRTLLVQLSDGAGSLLVCRIETLVSLNSTHHSFIRTTLEGEGQYRLVRTLSRPRGNTKESLDPRKMENIGQKTFAISRGTIKDSTSRGPQVIIRETTTRSSLTYCCAAGFIETKIPAWHNRWDKEGIITAEFELQLSQGNPETRTMVSAFTTSLDGPEEELSSRVTAELYTAIETGWDHSVAAQAACLAAFWKNADIRIAHMPEYTRALRFSAYGLIQSVTEDPRKNSSAKGLSSCGYNGHYFWDSDVYVQGALNNSAPKKAKALVRYRIKKLKEAVERAGELSEKGALYPWRTINGRESSAFFPAGTAQFHINADVIWGMKDYIRTTGDRGLLKEGGAEMLFQTARFWAGFAAQVPGKGYCFHCVTGPDEYTALVNNNFYTNLMARENLAWAAETAGELAAESPEIMIELKSRIGLTEEETDRWKKIAGEVYLPRLKDTEIFMQDDSFLEKPLWNWAETPPEKRPLLLHYHPLKIYRHKVMKQPDVIVGLLLERRLFNPEIIGENFDYYDPLTSGDSSLSAAIQAAVGALSGRHIQAEKYFWKTLFLDLKDLEGNTDNGIHLASMGGARMAFLYGFAGYQVLPSGPAFKIRFPESWGAVSFSLLYRGIRLGLTTVPENKTLIITASAPLEVMINGETVSLPENRPLTIPQDQDETL